MIFDTSVVPVPLDYESAAHSGMGKSMYISMKEFAKLEEAMRGILSLNSRLNSVFGDFFFVTWGMGLKSRFSGDETFIDALASQGFLWDRVDFNNLYLDLGVNFGCPQHGLSGMWSTGNSTNFRAIIDNFLAPEETFMWRKYRHDPFCDHLGVGGFKYSSPKSDFIRVTAYSHSKEPFYRRSTMGERHGDDFQPDEVLRVSRHFIKQVRKMKHCLSLMKSSSYGVRLEVRFTANNWDNLYCRTLELAKNQLQLHINWYKSHAIWSFVDNRLDALVSLAKNFHDQAETRFTASQLTGVAFITFMLSALVHRPLDRNWWLPFADQLKAHRCRKSMALFVPSLFKLSNDNTRWSCVVSLKQHLHGVFHRDVLTKVTPDLQDVLELPEWHYKSPTILTMKSMGISLDFELNIYAPYIDLLNKENFYWNRAILFINHYGLTDALVEPFVNLMMHEVIFKFSKWSKYCKDEESYQKLQAYGSNFFRDINYIKDIIKVP
ncbi:hypothetical protein G6F55_012267 [Rhizopus delemar]|uniref:Uncharacterized protein n=2 Tax=Rhizopus TaxID=4842 RepID=A0A9P7CHP2_9FUNG|nr:hypothetical protein G6F55_012267 [Rhizopus delemar]KAG1519246.1 hypothetical protein G6F52_008807 [Rhizopus delemar]KAG1533697.1 hypothetical protein G6F51_012483 [Rhizopus arrhizus]KAG1558880.1 hypothetical protein G6F50_012460 [Rhizopus delemar]KAG1616291.1 hypothetical protein G6F45_012302 [Rhizopus arrhizus]